MRKFFVVLLLLNAMIASAAAQTGNTRPRVTPPREDNDSDVLKVETTMVTLPVSVFDRAGKFVGDLRQQDFQVFEDGKQQEVSYFAASEQPITVALLIDCSTSSLFEINQIREAAATFVRQLKPADQVMIVAFDEKVRVLSEPTNDRNRLFKAINKAKIRGSTSLYDAVDFTLNERLKQIQGRKAVVLFTDGVDTFSHIGTYQSNVRQAEESNQPFFTILLDTYDPQLDDGKPGDGSTREDYALANRYINELSDKTGGTVFKAEAAQNLNQIFANVADFLRRQYNIGYYPTDAGKPGQRKQIKVSINRPNAVVRTRDSYLVGK